jgi:hypothetical protein
MSKRFGAIALSLSLLVLSGSHTLAPDVTYVSVTSVEFAGALGRAANFVSRLAGQSTDLTQTVYLKGNKMLRADESTSMLFDLDAEHIVTLNHEEKTYSILTFADFRSRMEEMVRDVTDEMEGGEAADDAGEQGREETDSQSEEAPEMDFRFDFAVDPTGETSTVNGHPAERFLMTISMEARRAEAAEPSSEEAVPEGTLVIASDLWMSSDLQGYDEYETFHLRFAETFGGSMLGEKEMQSMAGALQQAFASDPRIREGLEKAQTEAANLEGVEVRNVTHVVLVAAGETFDPALAFQSAEQVEEEEEERPARGLGRFARRLAQQASGLANEPEEEAAAEAATQGTLLTVTTEMRDYSTASVPASIFDLPGDYAEVPFGSR